MSADEPQLVTSDWIEAEFADPIESMTTRLEDYRPFEEISVRPPGCVDSTDDGEHKFLVPIVLRSDGYQDERLMARVYLTIEMAVASGVVNQPDVELVFNTGWKIFGRVTDVEFQPGEGCVDSVIDFYESEAQNR